MGIQELADVLDVALHFMGKRRQNLIRRDSVSATNVPNDGFYLGVTTPDVLVGNLTEAVGSRRCVLTYHSPRHNERTNCRRTLYRILCRRSTGDLVRELKRGRAQLRGGWLPGLL